VDSSISPYNHKNHSKQWRCPIAVHIRTLSSLMGGFVRQESSMGCKANHRVAGRRIGKTKVRKPIREGRYLVFNRRNTPQLVTAVRLWLAWLANEKRKNRTSHFSQRNGLRKIPARIPFSRKPIRLDRWICLLPHSGHCMMAILRMQQGHPKLPSNLLRPGGATSVPFWTVQFGRFGAIGTTSFLRAPIRIVPFLLLSKLLYLPMKHRVRLKLTAGTQ
jgi:hypothetical protein